MPTKSQIKPYFADPGRVFILETELSAWRGTPFVANMARPGLGADCVRFAHAVLHNVGALPEIAWPRYGVTGGGEGLFEQLCAEVEKVPGVRRWWGVGVSENYLPGDLLVFSSGRLMHHIGLYAGGDQFWNALQTYGVCQLNLTDPTWSKRLRRVYRVYGEGAQP